MLNEIVEAIKGPLVVKDPTLEGMRKIFDLSVSTESGNYDLYVRFIYVLPKKGRKETIFTR